MKHTRRAPRDLLVGVLLALTCSTAVAQQEQWAGTYHCGALKSDPDSRPGYTSPAKLTVKDGAAILLRDSGRIRESLAGNVAADGTVTLEGTGQFKDSGISWRFRFEGRFEGAKLEAKGAMYPARGGAALRDCTMTLSRTSAPAAREAKVAPPERMQAAPAPPAVEKETAPAPSVATGDAAPAPQVVAKAEAPSPARKAESPPPLEADPPPAVRAALESPGTQSQPKGERSLFGYSRTDAALLAVFIVCAIVGVALLVYDWRRNHKR